jgi:GNAT superfamily N-acetyltransferase
LKISSDLQLVFSNSKFKCFVYDSEKLIGAGRALADGVDCAYICDIAVHPDYQGTGLGKEIVNSLLNQSKGHKKFGFKRMATAMAIFENQEVATDQGLLIDT